MRAQKLLKRWKLFCVLVFSLHLKSFRKKSEIVLITSYTMLLNYTLLNHLWRIYLHVFVRWLLLRWLLLIFCLCKTPLGETRCLGNPYFLHFLITGCLSIQFFDSPITQSIRPPMFTYPSLCSTCVTYGTSCHAIGHQVLLTQSLPSKAEDFPWAGNPSKHMPLLTYLAWLQPICYNPKFVFKHIKTEKVLLVVETLMKNIKVATLISS